MKKNLMAVLTASSVAVMAAGATLAAYAEPDQEDQIKDDDGTYAYGGVSHCLYINTFEGFENWQTAGINSDEIETISFEHFSGANGSEIPAGAFEGLTSVKNVKLGTNISKIGDNAFKGCTSLVNIEFLPAGPSMTIGKSAFEGCTSISHLSFMMTMVEEIGESAFEGCTSILTLLFNNSSVKKIDKSAFKGCTGLMDITFGFALEEIGESAFEGCANLGKTEELADGETNNCDIKIVTHGIDYESADIENSNLKKIGSRAFYGCEKLTNFKFPSKVKTIGEYAFANCVSLYDVDMSSCYMLESIEKYAFFNCLTLIQVQFPSSRIYDKGNNVYYDHSIPKHTIAEGAFRNCSWLGGVILSPYVGDVAPGAFYKCKKLEYIGYYVDDALGIGKNIEIKVDTEHSTQDAPNPPKKAESTVEEQSARLLAASGEDSETVTIYVPPEVTAFSFDKVMTDDSERTAVLNDAIDKLFKKMLAENEITYDGRAFYCAPIEPTKLEKPIKPTKEGSGYYFGYNDVVIGFSNGDGTVNEESFAYALDTWKRDYEQWEKADAQYPTAYAQYEQDCKDYEAWDNLNPQDNKAMFELWGKMWYTYEFIGLTMKFDYRNVLYHVTLHHEPTSKEEALSGVSLYSRQRSGASKLPIVLPEKFRYDVDIYSITRVNDSDDVIVDIPVTGGKNNAYWYDFSIMEGMGYKFTANSLLSEDRTYRSERDIDNPTASGIHGNTSQGIQTIKYNNENKGDLDDLNPPSSSSNSSDTTTPGDTPPSGGTSNPPSPPPPSNTDDPIEPDPSEPESSEPESSEPESSEPESSEPESSEPESSKPESSEPENNPPTGTRFLAPIVLVGAAVAVVAARRRKMK